MSRVIRGDGGNVVPAEVYDASEEARRIVADAERRAQAIVASAREQADALRAGARSEGLCAAQTEVAARLLAAGRVRDGALAAAEREVLRLAIAAARRIVVTELTTAPDAMRAIVVELLERARSAKRIVVRVHPDLVARVAELGARTAGLYAVEADASIEPGGCVLATDLGELDARLDVQLASLERALLGDGE